MTPPRTTIVAAPGVDLYVDTSGSGPLLLLIPGGPTDAGVFRGLTEALADRYTVAAYDPRGNSRSAFAGEPEDFDLDRQADDAALLIETLGSGPAFVFGTSGGAQVALNLAVRHPHLAAAVVAHEPPCLTLLPDPAEGGAIIEAVLDTYVAKGVGPAMGTFMALAGLGGGAPPPSPSPRQPQAGGGGPGMGGNMAYFLGYAFEPIGRFTPDIPALRAGPTLVTVGVGAASAGQLARRAAEALAAKLAVEPVVFPGGHGGYGSEPAEFGRVLDGVLRAERAIAAE